MGGEYLLETEATELLFEDGSCVGAKAVKADGTDVTIHAKAVLCCSGGYAGSEDLQRAFQGDAYKLYGMYTNNGRMIASAIENGAGTYSIGIYPMSHFVAPSQITTCFSFEDNDIPYGLVCTAEGMAVNRNGDRFIDESAIAMQAFYQGSEYFTVYSSDQIDILREKGLSANASGRYLSQGGITADTPLKNIDAVIDYGVENGFIYKAATLDELAEQIGVPAENLKASVAGYQPDDDAFGKDPSKFERLGTIAEDAEYYVAFTGCPYIYSTCGGLDVNENFQVLDTEGNSSMRRKPTPTTAAAPRATPSSPVGTQATLRPNRSSPHNPHPGNQPAGPGASHPGPAVSVRNIPVIENCLQCPGHFGFPASTELPESGGYGVLNIKTGPPEATLNEKILLFTGPARRRQRGRRRRRRRRPS